MTAGASADEWGGWQWVGWVLNVGVETETFMVWLGRHTTSWRICLSLYCTYTIPLSLDGG